MGAAHTIDNRLVDAALTKTIALPASASANTVTAGIDLGDGLEKGKYELELSIPALSTTIAPDTRTVTLTIEQSASATFASGVSTINTLALAGASGAGIAASTLYARASVNNGRYVRGKVAFGASTTDGSALSQTFKAKI
jgi:hypothetical protein